LRAGSFDYQGANTSPVCFSRNISPPTDRPKGLLDTRPHRPSFKLLNLDPMSLRPRRPGDSVKALRGNRPKSIQRLKFTVRNARIISIFMVIVCIFLVDGWCSISVLRYDSLCSKLPANLRNYSAVLMGVWCCCPWFSLDLEYFEDKTTGRHFADEADPECPPDIS